MKKETEKKGKKPRKPIVMTEARKIQLAAARAKLANSGKSPQQISRDTRMQVIEWVHCWGYTSSAHIQELLGKTSGSVAQKLANQGWLVATKTESGTPTVIYALSESGLQEAERHSQMLYRYPEIDPYKIDQKLVRHNLLAQKITINAIKSGRFSHFETERMFATAGDKSGVKRPDVIWITKTNLRIGIEVELSAKWSRDLDEFVLGIVNALQDTTEKPAHYGRFIVVSDSQAIINRYKQAMDPDAKLNIWKKNDRKHWVIDKSDPIPDWLIGKIDFKLLEY